MNIKDLIKRPAKPKPPVKQLKATARRATIADEPDYYDDEPNVRLSKAFLVVMLLHVVAVGGIFAFSSLKKERAATEETQPAPVSSTVPADMPADSRIYVVGEGETLTDVASAFGVTRKDLQGANHLAENASVKEGDKLVIPAKSSTQPVPLDVQKLLKLSQKPVAVPVVASKTTPATPVKASNVPHASDKTYVVQKGDNPVGIAKKLKVSYAALIKVNNITDPRKLQIGQKLIVPE